MRAVHKSWQDRRPNWSRRVRWYEGDDDIRLEFTDADGRHNEYFRNRLDAQGEYDRFRTGEHAAWPNPSPDQ